MKNESICYIFQNFINALNISKNLNSLITRIDCYIGREIRNSKFIKRVQRRKKLCGYKVQKCNWFDYYSILCIYVYICIFKKAYKNLKITIYLKIFYQFDNYDLAVLNPHSKWDYRTTSLPRHLIHTSIIKQFQCSEYSSSKMFLQQHSYS